MNQAPSWLLDLIRPKAYAPPLLPVEAVARDGHAYARTAVQACLGELSQAIPGQRNATAFRVGCRLVELARAPWAGLDFNQIRTAFMDACAVANTDGHFQDGEAWSVWLKAERKATEPATLPPAAHLGTLITFESLPPGAADFGVAAQAAASGNGTGPDQSGLAGGAAPAVTDPFELAVRREHWMLAVRDEARRRHDAARATRPNWAAELLSPSQLATLPEPEAVVDGWFFRDSLARIVGPPRGLKSFIAVDLACCVATGRPWHGHITKQGPVVLVVGEGAHGVRQRIRAWEDQHGLTIPEDLLLVLPWAVQTAGPDWSDFVSHLSGLKPSMVVLDTQARVTVGRDENSAQDMGEAIAGWETMRVATGACVLLVHHTGVSGGERGRGSGAVFGALTSELLAARSGLNVTVSCTKQKDVIEPSPMMLSAQPVGASLVLVGAMDPDRDGLINPMVPRNVNRERALTLVHVLRDFTGTNGGTRAEIKGLFLGRDGVRELGAVAQRQAFARAWNELERAGRIARNPLAQRFLYVEIAGLDDLDTNPADTTDFGWPIAVSRTNEPFRQGQ